MEGECHTLVLTRQVNQTILIAPGIKIVVLGIEPGRVRLGIDCDRSVKVLRGELLERKDERRRT